jgi:hypothetical protein
LQGVRRILQIRLDIVQILHLIARLRLGCNIENGELGYMASVPFGILYPDLSRVCKVFGGGGLYGSDATLRIDYPSWCPALKISQVECLSTLFIDSSALLSV